MKKTFEQKYYQSIKIDNTGNKNLYLGVVEGEGVEEGEGSSSDSIVKKR